MNNNTKTFTNESGAERKRVIVRSPQNEIENYYLMTQDQIDAINALIEDDVIDCDSIELTVIEDLAWQTV